MRNNQMQIKPKRAFLYSFIKRIQGIGREAVFTYTTPINSLLEQMSVGIG